MSKLNIETDKFVEDELLELAKTGSVTCKIDSLKIPGTVTDLKKEASALTIEIEKKQIEFVRQFFII